LLARYVRFLDWVSEATQRPRPARAPVVVGSGDLVRNLPPGRPVLALLAAKLVCVGAWALTGSIWCCLGAVTSGVALIARVLFWGD
jgi:hypothetical protein